MRHAPCDLETTMPKLTGPDMKSIREGLLLSAQALTDRLKHAHLVPVGHVRTIQRWEEGARPVPDDIADYLLALEAEVERLVRAELDRVGDPSYPIERAGPIPLLRYETPEDMLETTDPHDDRIHAAVMQRARVKLRALGHRPHLVAFEPAPFQAWRKVHKLPDNQNARIRWAALRADEILFQADRGASNLPEPAAADVRRTPHPRAGGPQ
jgi:DNA-binding transcriptional regulator YiaG